MANELSFPATCNSYISLTSFLSRESDLIFDVNSIREIDKYLMVISVCQHQFAEVTGIIALV